jgi:1,4-dihydroxy-2-naphthoyl-CoA synthase
MAEPVSRDNRLATPRAAPHRGAAAPAEPVTLPNERTTPRAPVHQAFITPGLPPRTWPGHRDGGSGPAGRNLVPDAADIVIAADDVRFRQLEIGRGIVPFGGATFRAPARLGWGNAMRFLLTAEEFGAAEALRIGLVQEVVPAGAHVQRATELAHLIARQAPLGVQATLASARAGLGRGPDAARQCIAGLLPGLLRSQDAAEGLRSFLERREAHFTGQ